jgi:hypothetical protein
MSHDHAPVPSESPAAGREELREMAAGTAVGIGAVALVAGVVLPNTARSVTSSPVVNGGQFPSVLLLGGVLAAGLFLGGLAWSLAIERRRPWPFGSARPRRTPVAEQVFAVVAMTMATVVAWLAWPASGVVESADPGAFVTVSLPANLGRTFVAGLLVWWVAPAPFRVVRLVAARLRREAPLPLVEASQP